MLLETLPQSSAVGPRTFLWPGAASSCIGLQGLGGREGPTGIESSLTYQWGLSEGWQTYQHKLEVAIL